MSEGALLDVFDGVEEADGANSLTESMAWECGGTSGRASSILQ